MNKYHYVYEITYKNGKKYIGARSCTVHPENDVNYFGSSKHTPTKDQILNKVIIKIFSTRAAALEYESVLHKTYNVHISDMYYNKVCQTTSKFSTEGLNKANCGWLLQRSIKQSLYAGDKRTEKQKAGAAKMALTNTGTKNPRKGLKGISSNRFKPWYIRHPNGVYEVIEHLTISDFLQTAHCTPFTRSNIFHATRKHEHEELLQGVCKGYTVGFLPIPINHLKVASKMHKPWWYKTPDGITTYVFGYSQEEFCNQRFIKHLTRGIIRYGIKHNGPMTEYHSNTKFVGWEFGYLNNS